jgi:hypothetical protein
LSAGTLGKPYLNDLRERDCPHAAEIGAESHITTRLTLAGLYFPSQILPARETEVGF